MTKPNTTEAMHKLTETVRQTLPFNLPKEVLCSGCSRHGCAFKLLEYMDMELQDWEQRLENGEKPNFNDIQKLTKISQKVYKNLQKTGALDKAQDK